MVDRSLSALFDSVDHPRMVFAFPAFWLHPKDLPDEGLQAIIVSISHFVNAQMLHLVATPSLGYNSITTRSSLLGRLRNLGDDASWRVFFETYGCLIYNVARKSGVDDADAQDIVQETVIAVARKMPEFRYDPAAGSFKHWLLLITRRRIHDHLRQTYRLLALSPKASEYSRPQEFNEVPSPSLPPDAEIHAAWETEWRQSFLQAALAVIRQRANPKHYQAFDYCVLQGIKPGEVARRLGMSAAQVYLAKHRISSMVKRVAGKLELDATRSAQANL